MKQRQNPSIVALVLAGVALLGSAPVAALEPKLRTTLYGHTDRVKIGIFAPDGESLVTRADTVLLWDLASGKSTKIGEGLADPLIFSPDGRSLLLSRDASKEIQIYDLASGTNSVLQRTGPEQFLALSPDGTTQVLWDNKVVMRGLATPYDVTSGKDPVPLTGAGAVPLGPHRPALLFSSDSRTLAIKDQERNIMLWDVASGKSTVLPKSAGAWFVLSPDSKRLLAECGTQAKIESFKAVNDSSIQLFEVATGKSKATLKINPNDPPFQIVVFSPDSRKIASGSINLIKVWDAATGKPLTTMEKPGPSVSQLKFTPDGKTLVAGSTDKTIRFWNVASGKIAASLPMEALLLAFSPDGSTLATGGSDGRIQLWDMPGGKRVSK